jgi:hypothetical protein
VLAFTTYQPGAAFSCPVCKRVSLDFPDVKAARAVGRFNLTRKPESVVAFYFQVNFIGMMYRYERQEVTPEELAALHRDE